MPIGTGPVFPITILNPGAELGTTSGFIATNGGVSLRQSSPLADTGSWYFTGLSGQLHCEIYVDTPTYPLSLGVTSAELDNWLCRANWFVRYAGLSGAQDPVCTVVHFRTEAGSLIGTQKSSLLTTNQVWADNPQSVPIPPLTRRIDFGWYSFRTSGAANDGYVDNCSAHLSRPYSSSFVFSGVPTTIFQNGGAEVGSLFPWVNVVNSIFTANSDSLHKSGNYAFSCNSGVTGSMIQVIDINSIAVDSAALYNGNMQLMLSYDWTITNGLTDQGRVIIRCLDAASNELAASSGSLMPLGGRRVGLETNSLFFGAYQWCTIPNSTKLIELRASITTDEGNINNFRFDNASLWTVTGSQDLGIASGPTARRAFPSGVLSGRDFPTTSLREFPHD